MRNLKVIVEKTSTGYSAYLENYPVYTTGTDVKELTHNIIDAANFYFKEADQEITASNKNLIFNFSIPSLFLIVTDQYEILCKQDRDELLVIVAIYPGQKETF